MECPLNTSFIYKMSIFILTCFENLIILRLLEIFLTVLLIENKLYNNIQIYINIQFYINI